MSLPLLGVNIDHVATLRQLRGTPYPGLLEAAQMAERGGADQITVHLREDRRHIQDEDVKVLRTGLRVPLNLEMAVTLEMVRIACRVRPQWACLVPEKRRELTTEGGLDVVRASKRVGAAIRKLKQAGIRVSCFIEPDRSQVERSSKLGADAIELHTGSYCTAAQTAGGKGAVRAARELERIRKAAARARELGLEVHAGHGFDYECVRPVVELGAENGAPLISEYNIGHAIICRASLVGMERAVREMVSAIRAP